MDNLSDLMDRATRSLPPESPDLVERGMARGIQLRRRRTVALFTTTAVVATIAAIGGGVALAGYDDTTQQPPVSTNAPSPTPSSPTKRGEVTPTETLETLKNLLPKGMRTSQAQVLGGAGSGVHKATVIVDDGKGASLLSVQVGRVPPRGTCAGLTDCTVRKDGSVLVAREQPLYPYEPELNPEGYVQTSVELTRPDGSHIVLDNFNATADEGVRRTRQRPPFDPKALTAIADSKEWRFPRKAPGWNGPDPLNPGTGKPAVPVSETLATLKQALPAGLGISRPSTADSGPGENHASYLVDDGKGAALVHVKVAITTRDTRCTGEWWSSCVVRKDGSRLGHLDNRSTDVGNGRFSQARINYPDGRSITVSSYNGREAYGKTTSRAKPVLTAEQLVAIANHPGWKFPGIPTK